MRVQHTQIPLSKLRASRINVRRVKPKPDAQQRFVGSIGTFGLLVPLIVRPAADEKDAYEVIAGGRRFAALRQIHRTDDPNIRCDVRDVDDQMAEALSLAENFIREDMHPLDEAEAFARSASDEGMGAAAIADAFGVSERYVRQRMKLAALAKVIKVAYRQDAIDVATAETFASIPHDRQVVVWNELNGHPHNAEQVRHVIANGWIDASHALFNVQSVPASSVSSDLFSERVLIERSAFITAQLEALAAKRSALLEEGWQNVVAGRYEDIHDQPLARDIPDREFDPDTIRKLMKINDRRQRWEAKLEAVAGDNEKEISKIQNKLETLDSEEHAMEQQAPEFYSKETKSFATVFLMLYPDGQVRREYRVPKRARRSGGTTGDPVGDDFSQQPQPLTSDDLNERQVADTFTHQTLMVREALSKAPALRKRLLVLILHDKVRREALAVRHEPNAVTLRVTNGESFSSAPFDRLYNKRAALDPFVKEHLVEEAIAFQRLSDVTNDSLNQLIDLLITECLTAHLQRRTELVHQLYVDLKVDLRQSWYPDAAWLAGYQKIQLSHLMSELYGPRYDRNRETRKKSELLEALADLFANAAGGRLDDKELAQRVNAWIPPNLRETGAATTT